MTTTRTRRSRVLLAIACALGATVPLAPAAHAGVGDYTVNIGCQDGKASGNYSPQGWFSAESSRWSKIVDCGNSGLSQARNSLTFPVSQTTDIQAGWNFQAAGSPNMRTNPATKTPDAQFASQLDGSGNELNRATLTSVRARQLYVRNASNSNGAAYNTGLFTNLLAPSDTLGAAKVIGCNSGSFAGASTWPGAPGSDCGGTAVAYNSGSPVTVNVPAAALGHVEAAYFTVQCPGNNANCTPANSSAGMQISDISFSLRYTYPPEMNVTGPAAATQGQPASVTVDSKSLVGVYKTTVKVDGKDVATATNPACSSSAKDATITTYAPCVQTGDNYAPGADNGRIWGTGLQFATDGLAPGEHTGSVTVEDALGNVSTRPFTFRVNARSECSDGIDNDGDGQADMADPACHSDGNPSNPASFVERGEGGDCGDAKDNNGDGVIDAAQTSCHSDGNKNNPASYDPTRTETAEPTVPGPSQGGSAALLECSGRKLILIDVLPLTRTVAIYGVARTSFAGKTVTIYSAWNKKKVATTTVKGDGTFSTSAPLPTKSLRMKNSTRYQAKVEGESSVPLKLFRYTGVNALRVSGGQVSITGRFYGRYVKAQKLTLTRLSSCEGGKAKYTTVGTFKVRRGSFRISTPAPKGVAGAVYRVRAQRGRGVTFSLPKPADF